MIKRTAAAMPHVYKRLEIICAQHYYLDNQIYGKQWKKTSLLLLPLFCLSNPAPRYSRPTPSQFSAPQLLPVLHHAPPVPQ